MPSPFPGMDPWLEDAEVFRDVHSSLIFLLRKAVNAVLPRGYVARGTQLVWVDPELKREPDVGVFGRGERPDGGAVAELAGALAVAEAPALEPWEQPYLEILTGKGQRLVTMIEIVSLSNKKPGDGGRTAYQQKQQECRLGNVNMVELDLLRAGGHVTAVPLDHLRRVAGSFDYHTAITVAGSPSHFFAVPTRMTDRLPVIPIPLDPGIEPVRVDLQPLFDEVYDTGLYAEYTDYTRPPDPPLTPEQQAWADGLLRERDLRPPA
jgi:hypothetical protein